MSLLRGTLRRVCSSAMSAASTAEAATIAHVARRRRQYDGDERNAENNIAERTLLAKRGLSAVASYTRKKAPF